MRLIGFIIAVAIAMAALKLAAAVVALLILGGLVWAALTRPRETLGWLAGFTLLELASQNPATSIAMLGAIALFAIVSKR